MKLELGAIGKYGIRALIYMARAKHRTTRDEISEATGIPRRQLARVMAQLSSAGLVKSYEGKGGGAVLNRPPEDITLRDAVEATEGPFELRHCIMEQRPCGEGVPCVMHDAWIEGQKTILEYLESQSLAGFIVETVRKVERASDTDAPISLRPTVTTEDEGSREESEEN
ncbi:MAG: RrF2 family transcriptional regulator [Rubrobacteraceae bacterium]